MPAPATLIEIIEDAIARLNKQLPRIQRGLLDGVLGQLRGMKLDRNENIVNSVKNVRLLSTIKGRLQKLILTPEYKKAVKEFVKVFDAVSEFHAETFRDLEKSFKPPEVVKEIRKQSIGDVVKKLTEAGIGVGVGDKIADLLRQNMTTGTSYASLADQLREMISTTETPGILERHVKQIATDAVNQYSAQYMQTVSDDLGYEWFRYQGKDIATTRPFCDAMTDLKFFHISQVPDLLQAKGLYYMRDGVKTKVKINETTGLPAGMIPGTDAQNFFVRRGGYNCGHQIFPSVESRVPAEIKEFVFATPAYRAWKK